MPDFPPLLHAGTAALSLTLMSALPAQADLLPAWPVEVKVSSGETGRGVVWLTSLTRAHLCTAGAGLRCEGSFSVRNREVPQTFRVVCSNGAQADMTVQVRRKGLIVHPISAAGISDDGRRVTALFGPSDPSLKRGC